MNLSKPILAYSLSDFAKEIQEAVKEGWEIDEMNPGMMLGYLFTCQMLRDEEIIDPPKYNRAEQLAEARKTRAANRAKEVEQE